MAHRLLCLPLHMFGAISKLFKKSGDAPESASPLQTSPALKPVNPGTRVVSKDETPSRPPVSRAVSNPPPRLASQRGAVGDTMSIPYSSIIRLIPKELWGKLAPAGVAGFNLTIARANVAAQLPSGAVKVKFGDVRKGAPAGVFINTPAEDGRMVELPLSDILAQLHPDSYSRRPDQGRVEVQEDVPDVFGANAVTGAPIRILEKKEVTNTAALARQKNPDSSRPE